MMHFTIPEVMERQAGPGGGSNFFTFEVHLNGVHHCSVRYRQLYDLHQQLRKEAASEGTAIRVPSFPPKKLMVLSGAGLEERRLGLERYLQAVSQDPGLAAPWSSLAFNGFLLASQQETWAAEEAGQEVDIHVHLMNNQRITVAGSAILQTDDVLELVCSSLGVPEELTYYFGLYLIRRREECGNEVVIVKRLQQHDSPYISNKSHPGGKVNIFLRKSSWDPKVDDELMKSKAALNVIYTQTVSDIERGWIQASLDTKRQLASMQARGAKLEYMAVARHLKGYGYVHFSECLSDFPATNSRVKVLIGANELVVQLVPSAGSTFAACSQGPQDFQGADSDHSGGRNPVSADAALHQQVPKEARFKVTRMRCWRIMSAEGLALNSLGSNNLSGTGDLFACSSMPALELSFEYLMPATKEMQWVSITSPQAIIMSLCLQSMVEELLRIRDNPRGSPGSLSGSCLAESREGAGWAAPNHPKERCPTVRYYRHKRCDSTEVSVPIKFQAKPRNHHKVLTSASLGAKSDFLRNLGKRQYSVRSLSERFDVINMKATSRAAENVLIENEAFQDLKEDDMS